MMMINTETSVETNTEKKYTLILHVLIIYNVINIPVTNLDFKYRATNISGNIFGSPNQFATKLCSSI